jgi:hypothetical protein
VTLEDVYDFIANAGTYYGTLGGTSVPSAPGGKAGPGVRSASGPTDEVDRAKKVMQGAAHSMDSGPAVPARDLLSQYFSVQGNLRNAAIWIVIVLVGLIGVWGLIAPGGGVAVIERARK